ncbi:MULTISPECIES: ABC transporter substrate-binding protein [Microbacterium]|jgi:NitT/TauT family transport system substrate-binding protein|uniref:ABC transporter substrate-binding protein n=1 Tax=Microbacterium TaxID=33882 RepID=UPI001D177245|nr:ABC transporter substrate-binding protein [Microbacterium testaceum]MCC4249330.1 ABC transporter substrate-binding protein [Microbacterium testaceum]
MKITRPLAAGSLLLAATLIVTSCSSAPDASGDGGLSPAAIQLGWLPNVENMAVIVADEKGYFEDEGIDVEILPGGPDVTADAQIAGGNALMGILSAEVLANSAAAGSGLVAIGAIYQTTSSAVVTLADSGIEDITDLEGRSLGMSQTDAVVYGPFFDLVGVDADQIEQVMTGSDPASLASGEVDAITGTLANQPVVLAAQGYDVRSIPLADYGYNRWSGLLVVRESSLADPDERALIASMLTALQAGAEDTVADPEGAGQVVWDAYGEQLGLELETQVEGAKVWAELAQANSEQGLIKVDEAGLERLQQFYTTVGITTRAVDVFDLSLGEEVL